ncbi:MAG: 3-deoxy-manno-octulosonate cytidylyltransferase [candidate division WOR-3 bacterium]|nr:3-deoxy-manno-octulosonate cytidylyltransferase [candidate division WOR-3 bacterium]MCX7947379.1 3-deoxy-manno-octulosonate cytidylyltransferase [candidate division WOR-3 bacterium]MDW8150065.1 3-deoxy-manno-octulosonate cytidylyltransferase [candidate division WOR-3 bacterium]
MKNIIVIPARYNSQRLKGKVLLELKGKTILEWVLEKASKSKLAHDIVVATEDIRVYEHVEKLGYRCFLTSNEHKSGTDRISEVLYKLSEHYYIVNLQADEPFIEPKIIDSIFEKLHVDKEAHIITPVAKIRDEKEVNNPNIVKVVFDKNFFAIYFSRSAIPYNRSGNAVYYKHIGIYGYKRDSLFSFVNLSASKLEETEGLEQLRAIENGLKIRCILVNYDGISIDTIQDLEKARVILENGRDL